MKLGIGTYTYMWSIGFDGARPERPMRSIDLVRKAQQLGVSVVQFGPNLALYELDRAELDDVLSLAAAANIELEIGTRGIEVNHLQRLIDFTASCGASLLRTVPLIEGRVPTAPELGQLLPAIEGHARTARVRVAFENGQIPAAILDAAFEEVDSQWLGITLDTVNSLKIPEGTDEVARHLARWTKCLHIKDFVVHREWHMMGFRVEGRPAGQGQLDVPRLLRLLEEHGAECNAILELWPPEQPTLAATIALEQQWATDSIQYLKTLIKE